MKGESIVSIKMNSVEHKFKLHKKSKFSILIGHLDSRDT